MSPSLSKADAVRPLLVADQSVRSSLPVATSQSLIVLSKLAEASRRPSGLIAGVPDFAGMADEGPRLVPR